MPGFEKVEFMAGKEGNVYDVLISSVTSFDFRGVLDNTVEGLVHVTSLVDDYYHFDEKNMHWSESAAERYFVWGIVCVARLEK